MIPFLLITVISGCDRLVGSFTRRVDILSFKNLGGTVFQEPEQISLKRIHLDQAQLMGQLVIAEAKVVDIGNHKTYLIVNDNTTRLLVTTTGMITNDADLDYANQDTIRILGTIERGKRGLPYLDAISIKLVPAT